MDAPPRGEGNALVHALLSRNAVVRHDPNITVATSARIYGRSEGGMAETACRYFHDAWRWMETHVAMLAPRAVLPDALPDEIERATRFLAGRAA